MMRTYFSGDINSFSCSPTQVLWPHHNISCRLGYEWDLSRTRIFAAGVKSSNLQSIRSTIYNFFSSFNRKIEA